MEELSNGLCEARLKGAPAGLLLNLAKQLSTAKQRARAGQSALASIRAMPAMELEENLAPSGEMPVMRHAEADAVLNQELRICEDVLEEMRWVKGYGDAILRESEALHARRHAALRRDCAASTIQQFWRRHTAPPLVSSEQALPYTPAAEYLDAEAASRIQAAWRGLRRRTLLSRELSVLQQLADPVPLTAPEIYWPSALKLYVVMPCETLVFVHPTLTAWLCVPLGCVVRLVWAGWRRQASRTLCSPMLSSPCCLTSDRPRKASTRASAPHTPPYNILYLLPSRGGALKLRVPRDFAVCQPVSNVS